ncbi:MAG: class I SAM-dependent methyltransferase [Clostridiales bacterium]
MDKRLYIDNYYKGKMEKANEEYQILGWESREAHYKRFNMFESCFDFNGKKVLDVGCGVGSFYSYLKERGIDFKYTGVDLLKNMIDIAKKNNPDGNFICEDILNDKYSIENVYDIIVMSGIFNLKLGNNKKFIISTIKKLIECTKEGIIFNLLHTDSDDKEDLYYYIHHEEAVSLLKEVCGDTFKIDYIRGYLINDYTICLRKNAF